MNAPTSRIAPPFPTNPTVGQRHGNWTWNGVIWVCAPTTGIQVLCTVFTASGPYMPSPGLVSVVVECFGGGAGGGGAGSVNATYIITGGGGGSGGYSRKTLPAALVLGGVNVTIGPGGAGEAGTNPGMLQGENGVATSFGALCVANGGMGGNGNDSTTQFGWGGAGAAPGTGDVAMPGGPGQNGITNVTPETSLIAAGGAGGQMWGGAQHSVLASPSFGANGGAGYPNTGAGGGGGVVNQATAQTHATGGDGGSGLCIVTEYCWADASGSEDCMNPPLNVNARVAVTHVPWTGPGPCPPGWGQAPYVEYEGE